MKIFRDKGLLTLRIGRLYISNGWACKKAWRSYYGNKRPWRKFSRNPIFKRLSYVNANKSCIVLLGFIIIR